MSTLRSMLLPALCAVASLAAAPLAAQDAGAQFLPWLGCWEAVAAAPGAPLDDGVPVLCIRASADGEGIVVATLAGGALRAERELRADGELVPVDEGGCAGWESVAWSGDGHRLYLSGEARCEGGQERATSGLMAFTSPTEWMEIQAVDAGVDHVPVMARSYRLVAPPAFVPAGVLPATEERALALETARAVASRPLGVREVEEAARFVMPQVVQAALVEGAADVAVDAATLVRLADAGVHENILDVMVALANPHVFTLSVDEGAERVPTAATTPYFQDRWGYTGLYPGYDRYDRYGRYGSNFGFGLNYGWDYWGFGYGYDPYGRFYGRRGAGPIVIIDLPSDWANAVPSQRLKVVKGQGYTGRGEGSGGSAGRSTTVTSAPPMTGASAGGTSGTTTTKRKAKPRGGGGGG